MHYTPDTIRNQTVIRQKIGENFSRKSPIIQGYHFEIVLILRIVTFFET